jgi:bacillithiol synthase
MRLAPGRRRDYDGGMPQSIRIRDLPSCPPLYADLWEGRESVRSLLPRHFADPDAFAETAAAVRAGRHDRRGLCAVLRDQNERFGAGPQALGRIDQLLDPGSLVVIGGQQAGLFGGPLYTAHKALTVISLARAAQRRLGCPVVPVFWIASEDSDVAEIDHAHLTDREGALRELRLPVEAADRVPVSRIRLGERVAGLVDACAGLLPVGDAAEEVIAELRRCYTPGRTFPQAFGAWMARLFAEWGLVLVDPSDPRLKRMALPLFEREIRGGSPVTEAVLEQTRLMRAAGYEPQIELRPGFLTLFHQEPARHAITVAGDRLELKGSGRRFTRAELAARLAETPEAFTPNAVLRPLFQDTLFPSLAVVLGPSETAYFCELTLAYRRMDVPMPLIVPRASLTVAEEKTERLMRKLDLDLPRLLARGDRAVDDVVGRLIPGALTERIASARGRILEAWRGILEQIDALDPTLHPTAALGSARSAGQLDFVERKVMKAMRRRNDFLAGQVRRLVAELAPRGGLQERTHCALPLLARHGARALEQVLDAIDPMAAEHRLLVVQP